MFMRIILAGTFILLLFVSCSREVHIELIDARDGRLYQTVRIGDQIWMAENLAYMPYVCEVQSDSGIWVYGYDGTSTNWAEGLENYKTLGCLYNWATAMDLGNEFNAKWWGGGDSLHQGICPDGWHLPSQVDWQSLESYLDTEPDFDKSDDRRNTGNAGRKIKSDSVWPSGFEGTNEFKFNALPAGMRYPPGFYLNHYTYGYFWTSTEKYPTSAVYRYLRDSTDATYKGFPSKKLGLSVRCVRDY